MFREFLRKPSLGIEITATTVRLAAVSGKRPNVSIDAASTAGLPAGTVSDAFSSPDTGDVNGIADALRACLTAGGRPVRRAALSLPDSLFRVQLLDFDELPPSPADQERFVRWRIEKAAAFDLTGTMLRFSVHRREQKGYSALVCVARQAVVAQFEQAFAAAGLEPWSIGLSSFHCLNLYQALMESKSPVYAFVHLMEDAFAVMVVDRQRMKFYRWKEVKRGGAGELKTKIIRELGDSMHFYMHMDRSRTGELQQLYASGDSPLAREISGELADALSMNVTVVSPADVILRNSLPYDEISALSAALGAGTSL